MAGAAISFFVVGVLFFITFWKGNYADVSSQLNKDLFGSGSGSGFLVWAGAVALLAIIGSVLQIPRATKLFVILIIAVYIVRQPGLWAQVTSGLTSATAASPTPSTTAGTGQAVDALGNPVSSGSTSTAGTNATTQPAVASNAPTSIFSSLFNSSPSGSGGTGNGIGGWTSGTGALSLADLNPGLAAYYASLAAPNTGGQGHPQSDAAASGGDAGGTV